MILTKKLLGVFFACVLGFASVKAIGENAGISRVEPPSWWTGMEDPNLQILFYGTGLGKMDASIPDRKIRLLGVERVENPNYLFVNVQLPESYGKPHFDVVLSQGNKRITHRYPLAAKAKNVERGFTPKDVIYLITPDRFANGDSANDNSDDTLEKANPADENGRHGGDIQGIIDHLDFIADMGFTQIWSSPLLENNQEKYSYHGYSITDHYRIDPRFGDNDLFYQLVREARAKGIGVIQDVVLNHSGSEHWFVRDLPSQDWLNGGKDFVITNHKRESLHDPHAIASDRDGFSDGWFVPTMPDLNQRNPLLAKYLIQTNLWWIEQAGLSGLRIDTWSYSDPDFLSHWTARTMAEYPELNIVGEEWSLNKAILAYWQKGARRHNDYVSDLPTLFDFPLQAALVRALTEKESWGTGLFTLYDTLATDFVYADPSVLVTFGDNHDMSRLFTQLGEDVALTKMAIAVLLTTRGIPQWYYGTEVALANPNSDSHGEIRAQMPGGWPGHTSSAFTGVNLSPIQHELLNYSKALLNWRKTASAVHGGELRHYAPEAGVYTYFRIDDTQQIMVVMNRNAEATALPLEKYQSMLKGIHAARDVLTGKRYELRDGLSVAPRSTTVFELEKE